MDQHLLLLRDLTWRVIEGVEDQTGLKKRFSQLFSVGFPPEIQLPYAYLALLAHLLSLESLPIKPVQLPNGATCLDVGGFSREGQVPEPLESAELGSLWMILGLRLKNEILIYAGLKIAVWQTHILDHLGTPHFSLWNRQPPIEDYHHLLFTLAYRLTSEDRFYQLSHPRARLSKLETLVPEKKKDPFPLSSRHLAEEVTVGMIKFTTPECSIASCVTGWNSGFFSYHKESVAILNSGPQVKPFDSVQGFGIDRSCGGKFHDLLWEKTAYHFRLKGWTKIFALPTWMEVDTFYQAQTVTLSCLIQEDQPRHNLALVFYVKCEQISMGGVATLQARSLETYLGKSLPLEFRSRNEKIVFETQTDQVMEIIPLAGGNYFWGADFLIAFHVDENNSYKFTVRDS